MEVIEKWFEVFEKRKIRWKLHRECEGKQYPTKRFDYVKHQLLTFETLLDLESETT